MVEVRAGARRRGGMRRRRAARHRACGRRRPRPHDAAPRGRVRARGSALARACVDRLEHRWIAGTSGNEWRLERRVRTAGGGPGDERGGVPRAPTRARRRSPGGADGVPVQPDRGADPLPHRRRDARGRRDRRGQRARPEGRRRGAARARRGRIRRELRARRPRDRVRARVDPRRGSATAALLGGRRPAHDGFRRDFTAISGLSVVPRPAEHRAPRLPLHLAHPGHPARGGLRARRHRQPDRRRRDVHRQTARRVHHAS